MAYVAGPVIRPNQRLAPWVEQCYDMIQEAAWAAGASAPQPKVDPLLESGLPATFASQIAARIRDAGSVVAVFLPNDQSTPIECALAAAAGKRVLIIYEVGSVVPRILAGLPGVKTTLFDSSKTQTLLSEIKQFLVSS